MLSVLHEAEGLVGPASPPLPESLRLHHGGGFALLPETHIYSNFVSTLDGIVELGDPAVSSGSAISLRNDDDRFLMGLLRAFADHLLVGAGTFNAETASAWTAGAIYPSLAEEFAELRRGLGLAALPTLLVASRSGKLDPSHPAFAAQEVRAVSDLSALPAGRILCEGGPHLIGALAGRIDEVFLTLAPALAGRAGPERLSMMEGVALPARILPRHRLLSIRLAGSMLFLRYGRQD